MPKALTLFHNSGCSKSRAVLEILEKSGQSFEVVEYLTTPPSPAVLDSLLTQLGLEPQQIVRRGEDLFEELGLENNPPPNRAAWIQLLCENPILIERPIVADGNRAVVGRPPERVQEFLNQIQGKSRSGL